MCPRLGVPSSSLPWEDEGHITLKLITLTSGSEQYPTLNDTPENRRVNQGEMDGWGL